jgi:hypothetical protein
MRATQAELKNNLPTPLEPELHWAIFFLLNNYNLLAIKKNKKYVGKGCKQLLVSIRLLYSGCSDARCQQIIA